MPVSAKETFYFGEYGPSWYQELSDPQMAAADGLCTALDEDLGQDTIYRTKECMRGLGLHPLQSSSDTRELIRICQGNDITFLWYLMELFYASPIAGRRTYTINERLIMSAICHLDMVTTLRGLDAFLPLPQTIKKKRVSIVVRTPKKVYKSPYLEPLPRPKMPVSRQLPMPNIPKPCIAPYDIYLDPNYVVANESTRWFASLKYKEVSEVWEDQKSSILDQYCPIDGENREAHVKFLFDEFVSTTDCSCLADRRLTIVQPPSNPVLDYDQLDSQRTSEDFIQLLKIIIRQIMIREISVNLPVTCKCTCHNIRLCASGRKCAIDYRKLNHIRQRGDKLGLATHLPLKFRRIHQSIFGNCGPDDLLNKFNEIALRRNVVVYVCAQDIWKLHLYVWSDVKEQIGSACVCDRFVANADPHDDQLMNEMLGLALTQLKSDPKYVIPYLPHAEKLPLLQLWIRLRYGMKYDRSKRAAQLSKHTAQWMFYETIPTVNIRPAEPDSVCVRCNDLTYAQKDEALQCVQKLRDGYLERLNTALINDSRRFWPTMWPYFCRDGPPRKLYFAYMPSRFNDMPLVNIWGA